MSPHRRTPRKLWQIIHREVVWKMHACSCTCQGGDSSAIVQLYLGKLAHDSMMNGSNPNPTVTLSSGRNDITALGLDSNHFCRYQVNLQTTERTLLQ